MQVVVKVFLKISSLRPSHSTTEGIENDFWDAILSPCKIIYQCSVSCQAMWIQRNIAKVDNTKMAW